LCKKDAYKKIIPTLFKNNLSIPQSAKYIKLYLDAKDNLSIKSESCHGQKFRRQDSRDAPDATGQSGNFWID
jgi:hypothetical protein